MCDAKVAKVHHDGRRLSRKNKRQSDLGRHVHGEPIDRSKHDLFYAPSVGLGVKGILREQVGMRLRRTPELVWRKSACFATQLCRAFTSRST